MKITGIVFRKRSYRDYEYAYMGCITFLEIQNEVHINGERLKIIPLLSRNPDLTGEVGEWMEVDGDLEMKRILALNGNRNLLPIPVLTLN